MNIINPNKLHHSKWTAARPANKEKHFLVVERLLDADGHVTDVCLQAVHSRNDYWLPWQALQDDGIWLMGWR